MTKYNRDSIQWGNEAIDLITQLIKDFDSNLLEKYVEETMYDQGFNPITEMKEFLERYEAQND